MSKDNIITIREDITSDFNGTVIDIESCGEFNDQYADSRRFTDIQQVIFGYVDKKELCIVCAQGKEAIDELNSVAKQLLPSLERPFFAFNTHFESGVFFCQLGIKVIFDGELQGSWRENKGNARRSLDIPNYNDPFSDNGYQCMKAWECGDFNQAIAHNRACLLKERDILIKRGFRQPDEIQFVK